MFCNTVNGSRLLFAAGQRHQFHETVAENLRDQRETTGQRGLGRHQVPQGKSPHHNIAQSTCLL